MNKMRKHFLWSLSAVIGYLGMVTVNALANILPINGVNTGELSDYYPNLFVPAGLTFSIWGLIYLLLGLYVVYQIVTRSGKQAEYPFMNRTRLLFFISCIFNTGWIFSWHYRLVGLSLIIMVLLLGSLIALYLSLRIGVKQVSRAVRIFIHIPFSVYLGWITIATIANVTALLVHTGWNGFGLSEAVWTIIMLCIGLVVALVVLFTRNDPYYCLVIVWAYLGILIKRSAGKEILYPGIVITVSVCMFLIAAALIFRLVRKKLY